MTNLDTMSAASVSTRRRHQCDTAGQTSVAMARGRNSTATYTAADRISSSIHSTNAPTASSRPTSKSTKPAMLGSAAVVTRPDATPDSRVVTSPLVPPATASLSESVMARARTTSWIATPESNSAIGSRKRKARTS